MKTTISLIELMATCLRAAEGAGQIIRRVAEEGKTLQIKDKAAGADATSSTTTNESAVIDPQTKADRMAQYHILSTIKLSFPALRIIGEEDSYDYEEGAKELGSLGLPPSSFSSSAISSSSLLNGAPCRLPPDLESPPLDDVIVWVDPMDGTREFTQGYYDDVTVLIGVAVKGEAVGGVIHHPFVTRMIPLSPSTINTPPLKGSSIWALSGGTAEQSHIFPSSLLATAASRVHRRAFGVSRFRPDETLNEILHSLKAEEIVKIGGAGNKIAAVLHGTVDAYVFLSTTVGPFPDCLSSYFSLLLILNLASHLCLVLFRQRASGILPRGRRS